MGEPTGMDDWKGEHLIRAKPSQDERRVEASRVMAAAHKRMKAKAKAAQAKKVKK